LGRDRPSSLFSLPLGGGPRTVAGGQWRRHVLLHHRLRHAGPQEILLILLQQLFQCGVACRSQNLSIGLTKAGRSREYDLVWAAGRTRGSRGPGKAWTPRKARVLGGPAPSLQIA